MKTVLITGGSRGIGRAMVELFSKNGYAVAFTYKNSENEVRDEVTGSYAKTDDDVPFTNTDLYLTSLKSAKKIEEMIVNSSQYRNNNIL